jgi:hypothetical protein
MTTRSASESTIYTITVFTGLDWYMQTVIRYPLVTSSNSHCHRLVSKLPVIHDCGRMGAASVFFPVHRLADFYFQKIGAVITEVTRHRASPFVSIESNERVMFGSLLRLSVYLRIFTGGLFFSSQHNKQHLQCLVTLTVWSKLLKKKTRGSSLTAWRPLGGPSRPD